MHVYFPATRSWPEVFLAVAQIVRAAVENNNRIAADRANKVWS